MVNIMYRDPKIGIVIPHDAVRDQKIINWTNSGWGTVIEGMFYCVLLRTKMMRKIGILDQDFVHHCSDSFYQRYIQKKGWKVAVFRNKNLIRHVGFMSTRQIPNHMDIINQDRQTLLKKLKKI